MGCNNLLLLLIHCSVDMCSLMPCSNGATCTEGVCACADGFTGSHCQENINDCEPEPCEHGGRCVDLVNGENNHGNKLDVHFA